MKPLKICIIGLMLLCTFPLSAQKKYDVEYLTKVVYKNTKIEYKYIYSNNLANFVNQADRACVEFQKKAQQTWDVPLETNTIDRFADSALQKIQNVKYEAAKMPLYLGAEPYLKSALGYFDVLLDKVRAFERYGTLRAAGNPDTSDVIISASNNVNNILDNQIEKREELKLAKDKYEKTTYMEK